MQLNAPRYSRTHKRSNHSQPDLKHEGQRSGPSTILSYNAVNSSGKLAAYSCFELWRIISRFVFIELKVNVYLNRKFSLSNIIPLDPDKGEQMNRAPDMVSCTILSYLCRSDPSSPPWEFSKKCIPHVNQHWKQFAEHTLLLITLI